MASSAPVLWFKGRTDPNAYTIVASQVIKKQGGQKCYDSYSRGFFDLKNMVNDNSKYQMIHDIFNLCKVPTTPAEIESLIETLSDSLGTMAMVNYPYATSFINTLPPWPQQVACERANTPPAYSAYNYSNIQALQRGANVFYNYSANASFCLDVNQGSTGLDTSGWTVQTCIDMPMPIGDDPSQSCFTWDNWYEKGHTDFCK